MEKNLMWHSSASATDKGMRAVAYIVRWLVYRKGNRCRQVAPMCSPKYALFLEPAWVSRLNGISIGLAVCTAHSLSPWTDRTMICTRSICVTMPYFVKIGRTVAVVPRWLFIFSKWRPSTILDLCAYVFGPPTNSILWCLSLCKTW